MNGWLIFAALNGLCAILGGAYAAHGAQMALGDYGRINFEAAAQYQMIHALLLLIVTLWGEQRGGLRGALRLAAWAFVAGLLLFPGGLYILAFTGPSVLGRIVPLGGMALIFGWLMLAWHGVAEGKSGGR